MSDQVRGIIFVVVALAILFAWQHFFSPPPPVPGSKPAPAAQSAPASPPAAAPPGAAATAAGEAKPPVAAQAAAEKAVVVESPLYRVEFSNHGAVVRSWTLKKYFTEEKPPQPLELVNADAAKQMGWPFSLLLSDAPQTQLANDGLYQVSASYAQTKESGAAQKAPPASPEASEFHAPVTLAFHWSDAHLEVTKKFSFDASYETLVETSVSLDGKAVPGAALAWRGGFGDKAVPKQSATVNVFYKLNGKLETLQYKKLGISGNQAQPALQPGPMEFTGLEDQFFTAAFLPDGTDLSLWHWTQDHSIVEEGKPASEPEAQMAAGSPLPGPVRLRAFVGPKDLAILERVKPPLAELVQFGWTGVIAKPLLFILQWTYKYVPNYGWAIILLTLVINFAMFPLKMKSYRSMQKMQKVGPEIKSIQDRYKKYPMSDPRKRKMNEEVMAIYQREGINPMGSCLPMVFQMPIWWALWRVLNGAIELRHAPWLGWIHDLSAMDPYYILPILMTITMYLMTKMTPQTTADPAQQRMMTLMPLMMGFIFFRLSSGLNLYMFTSNLVGMGQQWYLNRTHPLPSTSKFKKKSE